MTFSSLLRMVKVPESWFVFGFLLWFSQNMCYVRSLLAFEFNMRSKIPIMRRNESSIEISRMTEMQDSEYTDGCVEAGILQHTPN